MATKTEDQILFESDRTCCICRDKTRPVQIHHLDGDHSNNTRTNLVVLCDPCHKLAHTDIPFSRNLTPEQVRLYDASWRSICASRLSPEQRPDEVDEYRQEAVLELSLCCHAWKNVYMTLQLQSPAGMRAPSGDIWDFLIESGQHEERYCQKLCSREMKKGGVSC